MKNIMNFTKMIPELKLSKGLKYNIETVGSPVLYPRRQLESNESEFEGCWGAKNPTPDCTTGSRVAWAHG
jgi:hypothetical protein